MRITISIIKRIRSYDIEYKEEDPAASFIWHRVSEYETATAIYNNILRGISKEDFAVVQQSSGVFGDYTIFESLTEWRLV
jgi:hypothetical protein